MPDADSAARYYSAITLIVQGVTFALARPTPIAGAPPSPDGESEPDADDVRQLRDDEIERWRALGTARDEVDADKLGECVAQWVVACGKLREARRRVAAADTG